MNDYIKRKDVDKYFNNRCAWYNFYETLNEIPSADVEPVRHGQWMLDEFGGRGLICSYCGNPATIDSKHEYVKTNYCPDCGAKMEKVK